MRRRLATTALAVAFLLLLGCTAGDGTSAPAPGDRGDAAAAAEAPPSAPAGAAPGPLLDAPAGAAFYEPPADLERWRNGDPIWAAPLSNPPPGTDGWRILYRSESVDGRPVAVSGVLYAPTAPPERPLPVLAVAHGTTGIGDHCAPSVLLDGGRAGEAQAAASVVGSAMVVVATDYEGLGTPGVHPYLVGISHGRSVLDSIRAAQRLPGTGASERSDSVVWGHSQGGQAALLTGELASTYAPDANLRGVAAGAPAAELAALGSSVPDGPFFGFVAMAAAGYAAAYPDLDLADVFTAEGLAAAEQVAGQCVMDAVAGLSGVDPTRHIHTDPRSVPVFARALEENSPGHRPAAVPVLLYHGEDDPLVPVGVSARVLERYCDHGSTVTRITYPGTDHTSVVAAAVADIRAFLEDRVAGHPAPSDC